MTAYKNNDKSALENAYKFEDEIDDISDNMARNHVDRLSNGECTAAVGTQYLSLSVNAERIADHFINVARTIKI